MLLMLAIAKAMANDDAVVMWLRTSAIPLKPVQAGNGFEDLDKFGKSLNGIRSQATRERQSGRDLGQSRFALSRCSGKRAKKCPQVAIPKAPNKDRRLRLRPNRA